MNGYLKFVERYVESKGSRYSASANSKGCWWRLKIWLWDFERTL